LDVVDPPSPMDAEAEHSLAALATPPSWCGHRWCPRPPLSTRPPSSTRPPPSTRPPVRAPDHRPEHQTTGQSCRPPWPVPLGAPGASLTRPPCSLKP
jgi:hypothetical protein